MSNETPTTYAAKLMSQGYSSDEVHEIMKKEKITFPSISEVLNEFLEKKNIRPDVLAELVGLKPADIYRFINKQRNPSRNDLIRIAIALTLNLDETQLLLKSANCVHLSPSRERDLVIMDAIINEKYSDLNEVLANKHMQNLDGKKNDYDPLLTMTALNMAIVSLHKIISTKNRLVLNQEYNNIINNLRMGEIEADPELTNLYQEIVRVINKGRATDEAMQSIEANYSDVKKKSIYEIIVSNMGTTFNVNILGWLGKLATISLSEYFSNVNNYANLQNNKFDALLTISKQEFEEYDLLQRNLLDASWKLLRKYSLPDEYILKQDSLDYFYTAIEEQEPSIRLEMLERLQKDFVMYSPYWYYRADAAFKAGNNSEVRKCIEKFDEVWCPVLRKDPYKVEILKYKVNEILQKNSNGKASSDEDMSLLLRYLATIKQNLQLNDWANNIYIAVAYYAIDQRDEAIKSIKTNLSFKLETDLSSKILLSIENKLPIYELWSMSENLEPTNTAITTVNNNEIKLEDDNKKSSSNLVTGILIFVNLK